MSAIVSVTVRGTELSYHLAAVSDGSTDEVQICTIEFRLFALPVGPKNVKKVDRTDGPCRKLAGLWRRRKLKVGAPAVRYQINGLGGHRLNSCMRCIVTSFIFCLFLGFAQPT
jgi:hypothetical protein